MNCDFTLQHYRQLLKAAQNAGFVVTGFRDLAKIKKTPKIIILRHDIDALPSRHLRLAQIEKTLGIRATYFIRVHGQYYYPSEQKTLKMLEKLLVFGHEIGLHSEARSLAPVFKMDPIDLFRSEKKFLEELLKIKIISASEHGDLSRKDDFWENTIFFQPEIIKTGIKFYPLKFKDFKYLSDSLRRWKEGCLCQNIKKYDKIQTLVHAEWWGKNAKEEMVKLNKAYAKI